MGLKLIHGGNKEKKRPKLSLTRIILKVNKTEDVPQTTDLYSQHAHS